MPPRLPLRAFALIALLVLLPTSAIAVRVMSYNTLRYPGTTGNGREDDFRLVISDIRPDLVIVQEITSTSGATEFLTDVLNTLEPGAWAMASFVNGPDTDSACYYRLSALEFVSHLVLGTSLRTINGWVMRFAGMPAPQGEFRIYSVHLKASQGGSNETQRLAEAQVLRSHLNGLDSTTNIIVGGDFNIYTSSEPAWGELTGSQADNDGQLLDPINRVGSWHNNATYRTVHTQSSRTTVLADGGASGGLDDRFDMLLVNDDMLNDTGIDFVTGSYRAHGQDGNHFNLAVNSGSNSVVTPEVADALHAASDHLPVYFDLRFVLTDTNTPSVLTTRLYPNVPNPFNPMTTIRFDLARGGPVELAIFNVKGQLVKTLVDRDYGAGEHHAIWDGTDSNGMPVASGIYHYRLRADGALKVRSMALLQ